MMLLRRSTAFIAIALALRPAKSEAPGPACDPNGKLANLNFTLKDMNGGNVTLSAFKGQVILLPLLIGDGRDDVKDAFGPLVGLPTNFLIGRDGRVCSSHTGLKLKEQF